MTSEQILPLIGVLVGAVATLAATALTDRLRWHRDQTIRWDERRLEAYMAFANTLKEMHRINFRLTRESRPGSRSLPIDREEGTRLLAQADMRQTQQWEALLLLADETTVDAARLWREASYVCERFALGAEAFTLEAWTAAVDAVDRSRDQFYVVARQSLGVSGSAPQFDHLQGRREARAH